MSSEFSSLSSKWLLPSVLAALQGGSQFSPHGRFLQLIKVAAVGSRTALTFSDTAHSIVAYATAECAAALLVDYDTLADLRGATFEVLGAELRAEKAPAKAPLWIRGDFEPCLIVSALEIRGGIGNRTYNNPVPLSNDGVCVAEMKKLGTDPVSLNKRAPVLEQADNARGWGATGRAPGWLVMPSPTAFTVVQTTAARAIDPTPLTPVALAPAPALVAAALVAQPERTTDSQAPQRTTEPSAASSSPRTFSAKTSVAQNDKTREKAANMAALAAVQTAGLVPNELEHSPPASSASQRLFSTPGGAGQTVPPARQKEAVVERTALYSPAPAPSPRALTPSAAPLSSASARVPSQTSDVIGLGSGDERRTSASDVSGSNNSAGGFLSSAGAQFMAKRARSMMPDDDAELVHPPLWAHAFGRAVSVHR